MRTFKKGLILALCLMLAGLLSACTVTVNVDPEDIAALGDVVKNYLVSYPVSETPEAYDPYACDCCDAPAEEGMAYREEEESPYIGLPNPIKECASLEEINAAAGTALAHPAVMGVTDESFCTITGSDAVLADYDFTLAGYRWCFRAGAVAAYDISGVYINAVPAFGEPKEGIEYAEGEGYKLARWFTLDGQYVLSVLDQGAMAQDTFAGIAEEMRSLVDPAMSEEDYKAYYASLAGEWQDENSQRAVMTVTAEEDCVRFEISWADDAATTERWTMTARLYEDGLLSYKDCKKSVVTCGEDGTAGETVVYENGEGFLYLSPEDGKIYWSGSAEDGMQETAFVRLPGSALEGYWLDIVSERALLTVTDIPGSDKLALEVSWSLSAFENTVWTMTGTYDENTGRLSYTDCEKKTTVYPENGPAEETVVYSNGEGFFTLVKEGFFSWNGADEVDCRACVFALAMG